ncbi:MAG: DNA-3-methyladenine glycosylase I [Holosporaceae bacterium]|jgi:DNA-3-methyladenine glycosylase I|nr:DNA-3-methyladenine glycosylase I [Holosporaceae bacterium]
MTVKRCSWANSSALLKRYHDEEWGKPTHDDRQLFEMLILEGKSCGLSWEIILKKRDRLRSAFDNFEPNILITYDDAKIDALMQDPGIIRHRLKAQAVVENARAYLKLKESYGSLDNFLQNYASNQPSQHNAFPKIIIRNETSDRLSKDLRKFGFKFVGSTIIYSFMQAVGIVDDHEPDCFASKTIGDAVCAILQ